MPISMDLHGGNNSNDLTSKYIKVVREKVSEVDLFLVIQIY